VLPTGCLTWFQANQACVLSGKRLLTNQEWQNAGAGTPDLTTDNGTTDCNINSGGPFNTGSRSSCISTYGIVDMGGNVSEWVADWVPQSTSCPMWGAFSDDRMCLSGASTTATGPGALLRGGGIHSSTDAGIFNVNAGFSPAWSDYGLGFRCAR